jgi:hypothetical protein
MLRLRQFEPDDVLAWVIKLRPYKAHLKPVAVAVADLP